MGTTVVSSFYHAYRLSLLRKAANSGIIENATYNFFDEAHMSS